MSLPQESKSPVAPDNNNVVAMAKDNADEAGSKSLTVTALRQQEKSQRKHPIAKLQGKEFEYLVRQNREVVLICKLFSIVQLSLRCEPRISILMLLLYNKN